MPTDIREQRLGAHVSIAGGMHNAFVNGAIGGCRCLQVFVKNQRQWKAKPFTEEDLSAWRQAWRGSEIRPIVAHASYLINLGSADRTLRRKSIRAFADELLRCGQLGIRGLVIHPGAHMGAGEDKGLERVIKALDAIHAAVPDSQTKTLLETTAGQGTSLGHRFEQIARVAERVAEPRRVGVCFDTAHVFAAGYDIRTREAYDETMKLFGRTIGLKRLRCIHMNDSARPLGSRVDRHAHIGAGHIGADAFGFIVNDARLARVPKIIETPKERAPDGRHYDMINLEFLRGLIGKPAA